MIEDLDVKSMLKNKNLAKSISEVSFSRFINILTYKGEWYGREVIKVDRYFASSKICNNCGSKNNDLTLSNREWKCNGCGIIHDRDYNAALNILNEGNRLKELELKEIGLSSPESCLEFI